MPRVRALHALLLALLLLVLPTVGLAAPHPAAAGHPMDTTADLGSGGVTLSRVSPVVAAPDEPITFTGVLDVEELGIDLRPPADPAPTDTGNDASPGTAPDADPADPPVASLEVRLGRTPIRSHADVATWVGSSDAVDGAVLARIDLPGGHSPDTARIPFTVTIDALGTATSEPYGVLPISLELHLPEQTEPLRALHTFIGYQVRKEYVPLALSWIVPFTVPADLDLVGDYGAERTEAWQRLVGSDGTLRSRLAATGEDMVWIIDPALLTAGPLPDPEPDEPDPSETTTGSGTGATTGTGTPSGAATGSGTTSTTTSETTEPTLEGTDAPEVPLTNAEREREVRAAFARDLLDAAGGRDVLLLPRHDADISTLPATTDTSTGAGALREALDPTLDVTAARDALTAAGARVLPTLWPTDPVWTGDHDRAFADLSGAATAGPWSVLTTAASATTPPTGPTPTATGGRLLPIHPALSSRAATGTTAATSTDTPGSIALTTGLALMADSLVTLNERAGTTRHALIALDRDLDTSETIPGMAAVLDQVPWLSTAPLTRMTGTVVFTTTPGDTAPDEPALTPERAALLTGTNERLPIAADLRINTGEDLATRGADTLAQLTSQRWRTSPEDWSTAYSPIADQVSQTFTAVHIPPRDIVFLADTGSMRVTVDNTLDDGLRNAYLSLTVDHPILRIENGPQPVEVGANSRSTVAFDASAIASGKVQVTAVVRAADGTNLSEPTTFTVRVSPTSDWIYWALGAVALVVIIIGIARMALRPRPPRD